MTSQQGFIIEFAEDLGLTGEMLATYLEEVSSTLTAACYKLNKNSYSSQELAQSDFQVVETEMTEGHPCFVANNGRIGFNTRDYHHYAPEAANSLQLVWIAARKDHTAFHAIDGVDYDSLIGAELDLSERLAFEHQLRQQQLDPEDYYLFPMHPWQWENKLVHLYAREIAAQKLVCVGRGHDHYLPQQSVRTLYNLSNSTRYYVKTALSILNMGFMRGLSAGYMAVTPAINQWLYQLVSRDSRLSALNFVPLQELATLGFSGSHYEAPAMGNTQYSKMLAALWRENPTLQLGRNESLATMASLLHLDKQGQSYIGAKIQASGVPASQWMQAYLKAYLIPLVHCFYRYKLVFMPHGENLILRFNQHLPVGVFIKDIGEEICLLNDDTQLDEEIKRIQITMPEEMELLSIFTDVFDCIFRFMVPILERENLMSAKGFWALIALEIKRYQAAHPELSQRYEQYDLFCDEFGLSCLNRLQLGNNKQMVDLTDPANSLKFAGTLTNPIAEFRQHSESALEIEAGLVEAEALVMEA